MTVNIDKDLVSKILDSPQAPALMNKINSLLKEEQQKRKNFYNEITEQEKAEFINGETIIHSPVMKRHNDACNNLARLINTYVSLHNLGFVGVEKILIQLTRNDYEPDICFFNTKQSKNFKENQTIFPSPDFIVEILSKATQKRDRGIKFEDYQAHGIKEYWVIDPKDKFVEQYILHKGIYNLAAKSKTGIIKSKAIPGFQIPIKSIFDKKSNIASLQEILEK